MKKQLYKIALSALLINSVNIYGSNINTKISGDFDFQMASVFTNLTESEKEAYNFRVTNNNDKFGFLSKANVYLDVNNTINNITYGAKISLQTTTKNTKSMPSFIYFESDIGRLEFGSNKSVYKTMGITGYSNANSVSYSGWFKPDISNSNIMYITSPSNFLDSYNIVKDQVELSRKVTYISPKINGLQIGLTYIPDSSNTGASGASSSNLFESPLTTYNESLSSPTTRYSFAIVDGIAMSVKYEKQSDNYSIKTSLVSEKGKVKAQEKVSDELKQIEVNNLLSIMFGFEARYNDMSISASYTNLGKSFTALKDKNSNKKSDYYIITGNYSFTKEIDTSISYFNSNLRGNEITSISFATSYKPLPNVKHYLEISQSNSKASYITDSNKQKIHVVSIGTKISF